VRRKEHQGPTTTDETLSYLELYLTLVVYCTLFVLIILCIFVFSCLLFRIYSIEKKQKKKQKTKN
jgi:preprotein translocase subunit YajC